MKHLTRPILWRGLLFVAMAALLALSLMSSPPPMLSTGWDKSNHAAAFAVLALLGNRSWPGRTVPTLLGLLAYGGLIEVLQSFTVDRSAEWGDLLADAVGLSFGQSAVWVLRFAGTCRGGLEKRGYLLKGGLRSHGVRKRGKNFP